MWWWQLLLHAGGSVPSPLRQRLADPTLFPQFCSFSFLEVWSPRAWSALTKNIAKIETMGSFLLKPKSWNESICEGKPWVLDILDSVIFHQMQTIQLPSLPPLFCLQDHMVSRNLRHSHFYCPPHQKCWALHWHRFLWKEWNYRIYLIENHFSEETT